MTNGNALAPIDFDPIIKALEYAAPMIKHTRVSLGDALDAACRRHGIALDDDSYSIAILSLAKYRERVASKQENEIP